MATRHLLDGCHRLEDFGHFDKQRLVVWLFHPPRPNTKRDIAQNVFVKVLAFGVRAIQRRSRPPASIYRRQFVQVFHE